MNQIFKLKDTVFDYLSPKRRRTLGPSPTTPAHREHSYLPASEPQGRKAQAAIRGRLHKVLPPPSDTRFTTGSRKRARESECDIFINESLGSEISPDESASQITAAETFVTYPPTEEEEDTEELGEEIEEDVVEESEVSPEDKVAEYLARQAELELRKDAIAQVKATGDWHAGEIYLFERLSLRSFEAVFPQEWKNEFPTLPEDIFGKAKKPTLFTYNYSNSQTGYVALQRLFKVGTRVETKVEIGAPTEQFIAYEIKKYIQWAEKDGGYNKLRFIPVLTLVSARPREAIDSISKKITAQMEFLAKKHRDHLILPAPRTNELGDVELYSKHPPLLYGIIVAQSLAIFVTLDSADPEAKLRHVAHVDFKENGHSIWSGLGVAIVIVLARNYIMAMKDELEEDDAESETDPDL